MKQRDDKSPGQSGLTTDMIKNLPPRAFNYYVKLIQNFWQDPNTYCNAWHTTLLRVVYKGKGNPQDPNNSRGIALKEPWKKPLPKSSVSFWLENSWNALKK